jgi:hypothetical protein
MGVPSPRDRAERLRETAKETPEAVNPDKVLELLRYPERQVQRIAAEAFLPLVTEHPDAGTNAVERLAYLLRSVDGEESEAAQEFARTLLLCLARIANAAPGSVLNARTEVLARLDPDGPLTPVASVCLAQFLEAGPVSFVSHVDRFEALLDADDPRVRRNGAHILSKLATTHPEAVLPTIGTLKDRLDDSDTETAKKSALVIGLAARNAPESVAAAAPALADALSSDDRGLRANAAGALADIAAGQPELVAEQSDPLVAHLEDDVAAVRRNSAAAVSRLADAGIHIDGLAHGALIELLDDPNPTVRATACRALGFMGSAVALELLRKTASEDDEQAVRMAARRALERT